MGDGEAQRGLDALGSALGAGSAEAAFALFRAVCLSVVPASRSIAWAESAWTAFHPTIPPAPLATALAVAQTDPSAARLLLARLAFGAGHTACALRVCRSAAEQAPDRAAPAFLLCVLQLRSGEAAAQRTLLDCLDRFPETSDGWTEIGDTLLARGKREAALLCFARGVPDAGLLVRRGLLARDLGRRAQARADFAAGVRLDDRSPRAWFLLGTAAQDERDGAAAAAAYRRALALAPGLAEAAVNLGTVLQDDGDLEGAKAAYGRGIAARPQAFGRVAQALAAAPRGEVWLDLTALRSSLTGAAAPAPDGHPGGPGPWCAPVEEPE